MIKAIAMPMYDDHEKYDCEKYATCYGEIFLHGEIEERNGYDHVLLKEKPVDDGIYDCAVFMGDKGACKAKLYFWKVKIDDGYGRVRWIKNRGYIVLDNDTKGKADAQKKFEVRCEYL